mgnify:CR=1 FL=1|jgi:hypothetical protein
MLSEITGDRGCVERSISLKGLLRTSSEAPLWEVMDVPDVPVALDLHIPPPHPRSIPQSPTQASCTDTCPPGLPLHTTEGR